MKTGEKLIGLAPCGQTQPYIFDYRPNELHDYYRLQEVVIKKGTPVQTLNYGVLSTYITHFSVSTAIQDCNACKITAPTWTPRPEQASLNCADWIIQTSAGLAAAQAPELSQGEKIRYQNERIRCQRGAAPAMRGRRSLPGAGNRHLFGEPAG